MITIRNISDKNSIPASAPLPPQDCYCEKCRKTMSPNNFYASNNLEKYPNGGRLNLCKKCITMHIDNFNPETYLWILKEVDVPYLPSAWNNFLTKYGKDPSSLTGLSIIGRYLAKMRLKEFKDFRWADSVYLQDRENQKVRETMQRSGYSAAEIDKTIATGQIPIPEAPVMPKEVMEDETTETHVQQESEPDYFESHSQGPPDPELNLTDEDILYLRMKWGKSYRPDEWVRLEQLYNDMMESYDIRSAGHIDTLKLICKTSLKANQLIDVGDIEGFQKTSKVYDSLMKSAALTAAQNKKDDGEAFDSVGEIVALCESEGFIPRYYTSGPQDKVDETLRDLKSYTYELVTGEMNLGNLIESSIKKMQEEENKEDLEDVEEEELTYEKVEEITDQDFQDLSDFISAEIEKDGNGDA